MITRHPDTLKAKSKTHEVTRLGGSNFRVISGATGNEYEVHALTGRQAYACTCKWSEYRPSENNGSCGCSHVIAVVAFVEAEKQRTIQAYSRYESAEKQHRPIKDIGDGILICSRKAC